jgi:PIN domain nuclease of toxin-antitoxin system
VRRLLLDTNVVVWLLLGDRARVSETAVAALEAQENDVVVSAASVWEIAIKRSLGKLTIEDRWPDALARLGFEPLPITAVHARAVELLPWHHRDPFDRLLIAQATEERCVVVTADDRFAAYDAEVVW